MNRDWCNGFRWDGGAGGHYESWFLRANHPSRPLAFWVRYTVFVPKGRPGDAVGELWATWFDGEARTVCAVKEVLPLARCRFDPRALGVTVGDATLGDDSLDGHATTHGRSVAWSLKYRSPEPPLLLLPERLYRGPFPKGVIASPNAVFDGEVVVDDVAHPIDGWVGSQHHNWGARHTDSYAWGQVAGFDGAPRSFLEVITARAKLGPARLPSATLVVLRHEGETFALNDLGTAFRASARYDFFAWELASRRGSTAVEARFEGGADAFVGLPYDNPPGGRKTCLNSKIARCTVTLRRDGRAPVVLTTQHRAAFEIVTGRDDHGVPVLAV